MSKKNTMDYKITEEYQDIYETIVSRVIEKVGDDGYTKHLQIDGLPIMIWKLLFGNKSSSRILQMVVDRYGFDEVESDLRWLKKLDEKKRKMN
tara:strand:+ start:28 stop:306 length:279 start_codon:yes stop_codon:yes gene_type:complete